MAGGGGIFQTFTTVKSCFAIHLGNCNAFEAELQAAMFTIERAKIYSWFPLWLECDSLLVVNLLQKRSVNVPWKFQA